MIYFWAKLAEEMNLGRFISQNTGLMIVSSNSFWQWKKSSLGRLDGSVGEWMDVKAGLRIAYSNQKGILVVKELQFPISIQKLHNDAEGPKTQTFLQYQDQDNLGARLNIQQDKKW